MKAINRYFVLAVSATLVAAYYGDLETPTTFGAELDVQSNAVSNDWATNYWYDPASWSAIPKFVTDPNNDASPVDGYDWLYTQVAHDDSWFYLHYSNSATFAGDRQLMYFDTDSDPNTGLPGFSGTLAIGAEYYLSGAALNQDGVGHLGYMNWDNLQDGDGNWDIVVSINRDTHMPGVTSFNFVNQNHDSGGDDWYPDLANTFPNGDWFRYEVTQPTEQAFGKTWSVYEPIHRDSESVQADIVGDTNSLTLTGVYGYSVQTAAVTPITPKVGTRVSYDFALTHELRDPLGDGGFGTWVAEAFGAFVNSDHDPSNAGIVSSRVGTRPFDDEPTYISYETVDGFEEGSATLLDPNGSFIEHHLGDGVHIEWLFTSETTIAVSVYSMNGSQLLGPTFVDEISSINDIKGLRFNLYDSEQTLTITNLQVGLTGDFNNDGKVDSTDLSDPTLGWQARYGTDLDGSDFIDWQRFFGSGVTLLNMVTAVPEPKTAVMVFAMTIVVGMSRRFNWEDKVFSQ